MTPPEQITDQPKRKATYSPERVLAALLTCRTHDEAAAQAGCSRTTIQRLLRRPDFRTKYREARRATLEGVLVRLQAIAGEAVEALRDALRAPMVADRIKASVAILRHVLKASELCDLSDQLGELEGLLRGVVRDDDETAKNGPGTD